MSKSFNKHPFNKHYLRSLVSILRKHGWEADIIDFDWSDFDKNTYLIRFGHPISYHRGGQSMLLMGDFGVTWEPARAYPTKAFGYIKGDNPSKDVHFMMKWAMEHYASDNEEVACVTTWILRPKKTNCKIFKTQTF